MQDERSLGNDNDVEIALSEDESRARVREELHARVQERFRKAKQSRKRVIGEKVRFQPKRSVKTREEYRNEIIEGSSSFQ